MKQINFTLNSEPVSVTLEGAKITQELLYGKTTRQFVNQNNEPLTKQTLTDLGEIVPTSEITTVQVDSEGALIDTPTYTLYGEEVKPSTSSFKEARELTQVHMDELLSLCTESVYSIETDLKPGLYKSTFNYRDGVNVQDCFILVSNKDSFLLSGKSKTFQPLLKTVNYSLFDEEEENSEEEDFDFSFDDF